MSESLEPIELPDGLFECPGCHAKLDSDLTEFSAWFSCSNCKWQKVEKDILGDDI